VFYRDKHEAAKDNYTDFDDVKGEGAAYINPFSGIRGDAK
jgi:hypothetical protein